MMGIVSRIYDNNYEVFAVYSETGIPKIGDIYDLEAVYCQEVYSREKTVAITQIENRPRANLSTDLNENARYHFSELTA